VTGCNSRMGMQAAKRRSAAQHGTARHGTAQRAYETPLLVSGISQNTTINKQTRRIGRREREGEREREREREREGGREGGREEREGTDARVISVLPSKARVHRQGASRRARCRAQEREAGRRGGLILAPSSVEEPHQLRERCMRRAWGFP